MIIPSEREKVPPKPVGQGKLLIVEGETPLHFFEALLRHLDLANKIEIRSYGGITQLHSFLKTIASTAEFRTRVTSLGIARDAEDNPTGAKQSVIDAVRSADMSEKVSVHIAILPDEGTHGMIETLCLRSVDPDPICECASGFFECLKNKSVDLPDSVKHAKRVARVYLAGKDLPEKHVGTAAYENVWPFSHAAFHELKAFLRGL